MIKDPIVRGNLKDFQSEYNFSKLNEDDAFEHFVNFLVFHRFNSEIFEETDFLEKINIDDGRNFGIDGIGFLINNTFIFNEDNIETFKKTSQNYPSLSADFVFTQAKTSPKFETGEILKFITAVKDFLDEQENGFLHDNKEIKELRKLKSTLLSYETLSCINKSQSPNCHLIFATTGKKTDDDLILKLVENQRKELEDKFPIFKNILISLMGREELIRYYQEYLNQVEVRVEFKERIDLGGIKGVGKAFLGYIKATEYLKLITDEQGKGNFRRNIFYENVRDFKGEDNKVNQDITATINDSEFQDKFVLLNNGITIVAKSVDTNFQGGEIKIINYQVVNGCQTSNVIYLNRARLTDSIMIPLKLIECTDNDITSEITKGTNNQNPVPEEAFIALEQFPKDLQAFFENISKDAPIKIYYERRSREFDFIQPRINQSKIFHLHKLIRAVVAMFAEQPHSCHRYPGELYKQTKSDIFGKNRKLFTEDQSFYPYYSSCYAYFVLETLFNEGVIYKKYKPYKYHILMTLRLLLENKQPKSFDRLKETEKYCELLLNRFWNKDKVKNLIIQSCKIIESVDKKNPTIKLKTRSSEFTNLLRSEIKKSKLF